MNFFAFLILAVMVGVIAMCQFFVRFGFHRVVMPWVIRGIMKSGLVDSLDLTPWLFEPIAPDDLPRHHRSFFDLHTTAFLQQGFQPLGDFVLRRDPAPSCSRYFLSPCRTIIGALSHYLDDKSISCASIALDGLYLETGNSPIDDLPPIEHGLQFFVLQSRDPQAIVEFHRRSTAQAARERRSELAPIDQAEMKTVLNYGRELSLRSLHKQGVLPDLPEFLRKQGSAAVGAA